jgi:LemA protein
MTALLGIAAFVAIVAIAFFNRLVGRRNQAMNALHGIDAMLKKRFDLMPNLVATVSEYAQHERELLSKVTAMRTRSGGGADAAARVRLDGETSSLVGQVLAVAEGYPQLKASDNFRSLQRMLSETEEQLSAARRAYNAAVTDFNDAVMMFPTNIIAGMFGFKELPLFTIAAEERGNVDVRKLFRAG